MIQSIYIVIAAMSGLIDLWLFFEVSNIKFKLNLKLALAILVMFVEFILNIAFDNIGIFLANIFEIIGLYLIYRNENTHIFILTSILFICTLDLLINIVSAFTTAVTNDEDGVYLSLFLLAIMIFIIIKYKSKIYDLLNNKDNRIILYILCYIWISNEVILLATLSSKNILYT